MGLFDFFSRKHGAVKAPSVRYPAEEVKYDPFTNAGSFVGHLAENGQHDLSAFMAFNYYKRTAPVHTGVSRIADEMCGIRPLLFNEKTKEFIDKHPLLDLLTNPSAFVRSRREFMTELVNNYLLTGNSYIWATGPQNRPPLEITVAGASTVSMDNGNDGYPSQMNVSTAQGRVNFLRDENGKIARYFWEDHGELYQIRTFNPSNQSNQKSFGLSQLTPLFHEIEQYNHASIHNLSLLKRGATMGGVFRPEGAELDAEQFAALKEEIDRFYSGSANSGRPMLAPKDLKFENMTQTNKDMDFNVLKKDVGSSIYNQLGIPLPLISPDHMTLDNFDSAREAFYEMTVIPLTKLLYAEIFQMLRVRYDDLREGDLTLSFDESTIPALKGKRMRELKEVNAMGILTLDEERAEIGREELPEHGEKVFKGKGSTPVGEESVKPEAGPTSNDGLKDFKLRLSKHVDDEGKRLFTDVQIQKMANKHYVHSADEKTS